MKYYRVKLSTGDELYHESKRSLSEDELLEALIAEAQLSPVDRDEVELVEDLSEDEYEDSVY
jgi:hypothetical protein